MRLYIYDEPNTRIMRRRCSRFRFSDRSCLIRNIEVHRTERGAKTSKQMIVRVMFYLPKNDKFIMSAHVKNITFATAKRYKLLTIHGLKSFAANLYYG